MNQLFTFNSEQFTSSFKPSLPKKMQSTEEAQRIKTEKHTSTFRSKKRMKRYEQIMEIASRNAVKLQAKVPQHQSKDQLKNYIVGHFSNASFNIEPITLKLVAKREEEEFKAKNKRCNSQMNTAKAEDNMLFTFYPKEAESRSEQNPAERTQEVNPKKIEVRSFSLKNSPIVDYRNSNKILPKVFRVKTNAEQEVSFCKRTRNLSELAQTSNDERNDERMDLVVLKESNKCEKQRNFSIKNYLNVNVSKHKTDICVNLERLLGKQVLFKKLSQKER